MKRLFWLGVAMEAYDATGHMLSALIRLTGSVPLWWFAYYYTAPLPTIAGLEWDIFWSCWHATAVGLIIVGYFAASRGTGTQVSTPVRFRPASPS
jgi:hypothetical protein